MNTRDEKAIKELTVEARRVLNRVSPRSLVATWLRQDGWVLVRLVEYLEETEE